MLVKWFTELFESYSHIIVTHPAVGEVSVVVLLSLSHPEVVCHLRVHIGFAGCPPPVFLFLPDLPPVAPKYPGVIHLKIRIQFPCSVWMSAVNFSSGEIETISFRASFYTCLTEILIA